MHGAAKRSKLAAVLGVAVLACGSEKPPVTPEPEPLPVAPPPPAPAPPAPQPSATLYERLGRQEALDAVVDELLPDVLADRRINKLFDRVKKDKDRAKAWRTRLVAELCVVSGGGEKCTYEGKSMKEAHKGMNLREGQWNAFLEDLTIALKTRSVDDGLAKELVDQLEQQTKADIVTPGTVR